MTSRLSYTKNAIVLVMACQHLSFTFWKSSYSLVPKLWQLANLCISDSFLPPPWRIFLQQSMHDTFWYFLSNSYENLGLFNKAVRARPFYGLAKEICLGLLFTLIELMKSSYSQLLLGAGNLTFAQPWNKLSWFFMLKGCYDNLCNFAPKAQTHCCPG